MLKKLYRYEFLAMLRCLIPVWCGAILLAALCRGVYELGNVYQDYCNKNATELLASVIYLTKVATSTLVSFSIGAMVIFTLVLSLVRFYKNLFSGEGYFTMCMPFKVSTHIWCKLITAFCCFIISGVVSELVLLIFNIGNESMAQFFDVLGNIFSQMDISKFIMWVEMLILGILSVACSILSLYASVVFGQSFKSKVGGTILGYFIKNIGLRIIYSVYVFICILILSLATKISSLIIIILLFGFIIIQAALSALFYLYIFKSMKNKFNI